MKLAEAKKLLKKHCRHHEEWHCGRADIYVTGRDENPRFDRRIEIYMDLKPYAVDINKISALLKLLDRLGKTIRFNIGIKRRRRRPLRIRAAADKKD